MNNEQKMVFEFHKLIDAYSRVEPGIPPANIAALRRTLISEEAIEFVRASENEDLIEVADALADLLVVTYGAFLAYGLDAEPIFKEVHRSNMTKGDGPVREDGKAMKPLTFEPPVLGKVIMDQVSKKPTLRAFYGEE